MGGKWVHRLSNLDPETREADCSNCGRVRIHQKGEWWACATGKAERRRRGRPPRQLQLPTPPKDLSHSGATYAERDAIGEAQNWRCGICGIDVKDDPVLDHKHDATGALRGILCRRCNVGLGMLYDDPRLLGAAIDYLARYE